MHRKCKEKNDWVETLYVVIIIVFVFENSLWILHFFQFFISSSEDLNLNVNWLQQVECVPVPSATPWTTTRTSEPVPVDDRRLLNRPTINGSLPATTARSSTATFPSQRTLDASSSTGLWRRPPREEESEDEQEDSYQELSQPDEDDLRTTIVKQYALHSVCSRQNIRLMGKRLNQVRADASLNDLYGKTDSEY